MLVDKAWSCGKPLVPGPWTEQDRGETRARGIGGLKQLENCLGPGADSPSDDGATPMLRATCAQALVAIKATQKQMGLDRSARWTGALLVVLVKPPPISTSDRRAIPMLTPGYHFPCRHPGGTQMAPSGPHMVVGRC